MKKMVRMRYFPEEEKMVKRRYFPGLIFESKSEIF